MSTASNWIAPLTAGYVQPVPDKCDRIVWRNQYFRLPIATPAEPTETQIASMLVELGLPAWSEEEQRRQFAIVRTFLRGSK